MKWLIPIVLLFLFSCKNERGEYPQDIYGNWVAQESEKSSIRFDSVYAILNIQYGNNLICDTAEYFYIQANGYGMIPIENEASELSIVEFSIKGDNTEMVAVGEDKDIQGLFTYHMVQKK